MSPPSMPVSTPPPPLSFLPLSPLTPPSSGVVVDVLLEHPNTMALTNPAQPATVNHFFNAMCRLLLPTAAHAASQ